MCGLAGIYSHKPVATELYDSLIHLQHRGQDAAGITTYNKHMHKTKGMGLVRDIFTEKKNKALEGKYRNRTYPISYPWWFYACVYYR